MSNKSNKLVALAVSVALGTVLVGCGGGSSSDTSSGGGVTASGVFIDAEVEGLTYQSGSSAPQTTDANGTFTYTVGQPLTFSVGGVELGTLADGAARCTPDDFVVPLNIARFLQTLDADGDPTNGIDLTVAATALAGTTVSSAVFENGDPVAFAADADIAAAVSTAAVATAATGGSATLLDVTTAATNLANGTNTVFTNAEISGKAFMVVDPLVPEIGLFQFNADGTAYEVFVTDTTSAGGDGSGTDDSWSIDANGIMTISDSIDSSTVTKTGQSSRAISISAINEGETTAFPLTLLTLAAVTAADLAGTGSKTFNVSNSDGTSSEVTFNIDGSMSVFDRDISGNPMPGTDTGLWSINSFGLVEIVDTVNGETATVALISGDLASSGEILVLDSIILSGTSSSPGSVAGLVLEHEEMRVSPITFTP